MIKGTALPTKQPNRRRYVRGQGHVTIESWESHDKDAIDGMYAQLIASGYTDVETFALDNGMRHRVEGSVQGQGDGAADTPVETWQLLAQSYSEDILNHPKSIALADDQIRKVVDAIKNPTPGQSPALTDANAINLYLLMLRGITSYMRTQFVLRFTTTVPNNSAVAGVAAMAGFEQRWSNGQLPELPTVIGAAVGAIPNNIAQSDASVNGEANSGQFSFSWIKQAPTMTTNIFGKTEVSVEWWLANWSTWIYSAKP